MDCRNYAATSSEEAPRILRSCEELLPCLLRRDSGVGGLTNRARSGEGGVSGGAGGDEEGTEKSEKNDMGSVLTEKKENASSFSTGMLTWSGGDR